MQLRLDGLDSHLAQCRVRGMAPLYTLYGDEHLLLLEAVDSLRKTARSLGYSEREIYTSERGFSWSSLRHASQSLSLFGERKLVELRIPSGKPGKDGAEALKDYALLQQQEAQQRAQPSATSASPETVTVVTLPRLDAATQKTAWFGALESAGVAIKVDSVERAQLPQWIAMRLAKQRQRVAGDETGKRALQFMVERVEGNLLAAHQEIQKLALLYPEGVLQEAQIRDAVLNVARYDVFKLSEAMLAGDVPRLVRMLDGLRGEGESPVLVLWAVIEEIRVLCKVRAGLDAGRPLAMLLRENRVWGVREKWLPLALQRVGARQLEAALGWAVKLDRQIKGLPVPELPADAWDGLQQLVCQIAEAPGTG